VVQAKLLDVGSGLGVVAGFCVEVEVVAVVATFVEVEVGDATGKVGGFVDRIGDAGSQA